MANHRDVFRKTLITAYMQVPAARRFFILSSVLGCMLLPASVSADAYDAGLERDC